MFLLVVTFSLKFKSFSTADHAYYFSIAYKLEIKEIARLQGNILEDKDGAYEEQLQIKEKM